MDAPITKLKCSKCPWAGTEHEAHDEFAEKVDGGRVDVWTCPECGHLAVEVKI